MLRKRLQIKYSKSGVDQEAIVYFHKDRLLTDKIVVGYNDPIFLKTKEGLKTEADVLAFFKAYSYTGKIKTNERDYTNLKLKEIMDIDIDFKSLVGEIYWGQYKITFDNGYVTLIYRGITNDGTHKLGGKKDFFELMDRVLNSYDKLDLLKYIQKKL